MAKRLTITNIRESQEIPWFYQTNPPQNVELEEWLQTNRDKVTFDVEIFSSSSDGDTQVLEYTFADDTIADEFVAFAESNNLGSLMNNYHASVGITSTRTITDL
jgi:hypothetical protein